MPSTELLTIRPPAPDFAREFANGLLAPDLPTPKAVMGPHGKRAEKRYNVYRNNVTVSLIGALASIFPAVERITGPDFFRAMARFHIRETPPTSALLFEYGRDFADFIDRYEYAQEMPWLSDVARIERAWLDAYHAADAPAVSLAALGAMPPEKLGALTFRPHPATRLMSSAHPVVTIFVLNRGNGPVDRVEDRPEDGLICRHQDEVSIRLLPSGGAAFIAALMNGECLAAAAAAALEISPDFDLSLAIGEMVEAGAFSHIEMEISDVEHA